MSKIKEVIKSETIHYLMNGVHINAHYDYDAGTVTFIDPRTGKIDEPQHFVFQARGAETLGGWVRIYDALKEVTIIADKKLREQAELREQQKLDELVNIWQAIEGEE